MSVSSTLFSPHELGIGFAAADQTSNNASRRRAILARRLVDNQPHTDSTPRSGEAPGAQPVR
jgi:hypothetical protein